MADRYIAAVDFGTSNCSLAYSIDGKQPSTSFIDVNGIKTLHLSDGRNRVPTAILLEPKETDDSIDDSDVVEIGMATQTAYFKNRSGMHSIPMEVVDIGIAAQTHFETLTTKEDCCRHLYFECFKMMLRPQQEEVITRQMKVLAFNGEYYYVVEVIAFFLNWLKVLFEKKLEVLDQRLPQENPQINTEEPRLLKAFDFTWVITVPAIWNEKGKQMMREAAYKAGLLADNTTSIDSFTPITQELKKVDMNEYYHKLILALEPECAALYCQKIPNDMVATYSKLGRHESSDCFMLVDVGGGTVDIAVCYSSSEDIFESVLPPTGNDWGGTKVNEEYSKLLQKIFGDPQFKRFCESGAEHQVVITSHIYHEFEKQKRLFCNNKKGMKKMTIRFDRKIIDFYGPERIEEGVAVLSDPGIEVKSTDQLVIHIPKAEELFAPAVKGIFDCIDYAIAKSPLPIHSVYLVGGFGGCQYICNKIKEYDKLRNSPRIIAPEDHQVAVVKGAIIFQQNPETMNSRVSSAYYGLEATVKYNHQKHDRRRKRYDLKRDCYVTDNAFEVILQKYQKVHFKEVLELYSFATPLSEKSDKVELKLFKTDKDGVSYTRNPNGKLCEGVEEIGKLELAVPPSTLPLASRTITLKFYIGGPEFRFEGQNDETEEKVHCMIDFLS